MAAKLRADRRGESSSSNLKFVASAVVEEAVSASQSEAGAESLSMYFKVVFSSKITSKITGEANWR